MQVLIADDDADLIEGLRWYLEAEGFEILAAQDGESCIEIFRKNKPELVILDIMMPKMDGIKVCEIISNESDSMIMMLSARDTEIDKVRALKLGADDYVTKPFHISELVARIHALLRRRNRSKERRSTYHYGNLDLYIDEHRVTINNEDVDLTSMEFELLAAFMKHPQLVLTRDHIIEAIWGDDFYGETRLVDNLVYRLREKLSSAGCDDFPIATIRGVGYVFRP